MRNKSLVLILSLLMVISGISGSVYAAGFSDMPAEGYWSTEVLEKAVENGLLNGYDDGTIKPKADLKRSEMAKIINKAFGTENEGSLEKYVDVKSGDWFYSDMAKAVAMGTFEGDGNKLNPEKAITREDAFLVIARALDLENTAEKPEGFPDLDKIGSWAKDAIYAMVDAGYVEGSDGKLNPKGNISREEFAQVMHNIIADYKPEDGQEIAGNAMIREAGEVLKDATIKGDLIVGDGVGEGALILDNVIIEGRLLVRGGGINSITIKGKSDIANITSAKVKGAVRIAVESEAKAGDLRVSGDDVIIEGKFNDINIVAEKIVVDARDASLENVRIEGHESKLIVGEDSTVEKLVLEGKMTEAEISGQVEDFVLDETAETPKIDIKKGGQVADMEVNTEATIDGEGEVGEVKANANDVVVNTVGTNVSAAEGTTGVMAGDKEVEAGSSETVGEEPPTGGGGLVPTPPTKTPKEEFLEALKVKIGKISVADANLEGENITVIFEKPKDEEELAYVKSVEKAAKDLVKAIISEVNAEETSLTISGKRFDLNQADVENEIKDHLLNEGAVDFLEEGYVEVDYTAEIKDNSNLKFDLTGKIIFKMVGVEGK